MFGTGFPLLEFINAVTGWNVTLEEIQMTGERIQTLRQLFNIREGIEPKQFRLPERFSQPAAMGPYRDAPQDFDLLQRQYYKGMGWNEKTGYPIKSRLEKLGLDALASDVLK
jgi:aldehyde:ferredoxin oxidoreductase